MFALLLILSSYLFSNQIDSGFTVSCRFDGFRNAVSMTTDGKGYIYVLDNESNEIIKFNHKLEEVKRTGKKGWDDGMFDSPTYIDGSSGLDLYVCDGKNYRVQRFDLNLSFISSLYTNNSIYDEKFRFDYPVASVVVNSNDIYVIDGDNKRFVVYPSGKFPFTSFGGFKSAESPMLEPVKIERDGNNILYILDKKNNCVFKYDSFGNFIHKYDLNNKIFSISLYNKLLFILTDSYLFIFDVEKNAYISKMENNFKFSVVDFFVNNLSNYYILEKDKIFLINKN